MKRIFTILSVVLILTLLSGCSKIKDIKITSFGIESLSPKGFRNVDAVLAVGIDNPTFAFAIQGLDGVVKYRGEEMATFFADTVSIDSRCAKVYDLPCSATLNDKISLSRAFSFLKKGSLEGFTTDITAKIRLRNGMRKTLKFKDLDLQQFIE